MYQYTRAQPALHETPVRFNTELSEDVDFWQYGPDCFSLFAHQRPRYLAWLGFFEHYRAVFGHDYPRYIQALNFLMKHSFLIATQDDYAHEYSIRFMTMIAEANLILDNEITAQAILSIASFYSNHRTFNTETFPLTGKTNLNDCTTFYRTCFDPHFQLPFCIALNKSICNEKHKQIIALLFEKGNLQKDFF
ncbi:MAG TPA: hypothetical protein ENH91_06885 [Leeuwenhoekiella sp.]|nr:hypothetical protein [Leeuwenhoekiella sp.]